MSLLGSLIGAAAPIIGGFIGGPAGAALGQVVGGVVSGATQRQPAVFTGTIPIPRAAGGALASFVPPSLPGVGQAFPATGAVQGRAVAPQVLSVLPDGAGDACPKGFHLDKKSRSYCVRNRRMNPLNGRAASRAIRRIKGARKMLMKIERQLPKPRATRTRSVRHITGPAHA